MKFTRDSSVSWLAVAGALAAVTGLGCRDSQGPGQSVDSLAALIVSNPAQSAVASFSGSAAAGTIYASLPPRSVSNGERIVIENRRTGAQTTAQFQDGGFDPVVVPATVGDTLDFRIYLAGSAGVLQFTKIVPARRPPVIVRTDPPAGKRDVPLNSVIILVFSEPIKPTTLTNSSVKLSLNGAPVAGTLGFANAEHLVVTFTPDVPLPAGSSYALSLTPAIEDLDGDALQQPVTIDFDTEDDTGTFSGGSGIYLADANGSGLSWLVRGNRPAWSRDGQRIAFDRFGEIYVINADGSNEVRLTPGMDPDWSPDGGSIVFSDGTGISVIDLADSATVQLIRSDFVAAVTSPIGIGKPAWSPDGLRIAFEHFGDGDFTPAQVYVMNADGSAPFLPTYTPGSASAESDPHWSADGTRIIFWSYDAGIALVSRYGGSVTTMYLNFPFACYGAAPDLSGDGTAVFTGRTAGSTDLYTLAPTGGLRLLVPNSYDGAWSPDGTRIALVHGTP